MWEIPACKGVDRWGLGGASAPLPHFFLIYYYTIGIEKIFNLDQVLVVINLKHRVMKLHSQKNAQTLRYLEAKC